MLISLALMFLIGLVLGELFQRLQIPGLVAMILTGVVLGPSVLNWIDPALLAIAPDLREIALIVILLRVGLQLDLKDLKMVGRPAFLLSFLPALLETAAMTLLAHFLLSMPWLEAAILGAVIAAVSPAVVVPRMLHLMETGAGWEKRIPHLIIAGASIDDIFVIVLFTGLVGMWSTGTFAMTSLLLIPVAILLGLILGIAVGWLLVFFFRRFHVRDTFKVLVILGISFFLVWLDKATEPWLPYSGLIAVIGLGGTILKTYDMLAKRLVGKFSKIWVFAELMLFVLVGAAVDITLIPQIGLSVVVVLFGALTIRMLGVFLSLLKTNLTWKERWFVAFAYIPKATVQAAIGSIPLTLGVASGEVILAVAVLAILITAPLGAFLIDHTKKSLLEMEH
jgi:solute carrier family 9B (sodium/hydrogen exchanger), member 1/2